MLFNKNCLYVYIFIFFNYEGKNKIILKIYFIIKFYLIYDILKNLKVAFKLFIRFINKN